MTLAISLVSAAAAAQAPDLSDIAACNNEAQLRVSGPSGSPGMTTTGRRPALKPAPPPTQTDPSGSIVTRSPDPLLRGMATDGLDDPAYRAAYRECMSKRAHVRR
jgi:hypothetical protein